MLVGEPRAAHQHVHARGDAWRGRPPPARPSCRRRRRRPPRPRTAAPRGAWRCSRRRPPRSAPAPAASSLRYCAPVAMTIGARPHHLAVGQMDAIGPASQSRRTTVRADGHLGAELLGLRQRASGQRLPGDAGGKAEVVLDARARARLPAGRGALEHQHVQPLGRGVDRGRQPRRPGADDHDVAHLRGSSVGAEARAPTPAPRSTGSQHVAAAAQDHRHLVDADVEAIEQRLHARDRSRRPGR